MGKMAVGMGMRFLFVLIFHSIVSLQCCLNFCCTANYDLSRVRLFETPWTVACQAPLSMGFPRQEYWSGLPFPSPGDLPNPGIEHVPPMSPSLQADSLPTEPSEKPMCTYIPSFRRFPSLLGQYRALNKVPCAIQ